MVPDQAYVGFAPYRLAGASGDRDSKYPSYFKLHVRWLRSLTRITYLSKLIGTHSLAAFPQLELFRVLESV
ncbi:hypothetical protein PB70LOC_00703 [Pectobacterium versatile]|nr:hypothetical protein F018LOC_00127 [Pectobacterium versatile]POY60217.1 hypothetical protein PB70LOC_00703 [Pectobacterium versatile]POY64311.1 hypothetical protein PB69LOC_00573 [Pectobacterium versatile]